MSVQLFPGNWKHFGLHLLHRGLSARVPLYNISLTGNHSQLRLLLAYEYRVWQTNWYQVVFYMNLASVCGTMMVAFVLSAIRVNSAFHNVLSNDIVAEHLEL